VTTLSDAITDQILMARLEICRREFMSRRITAEAVEAEIAAVESEVQLRKHKAS
jgi:hypothetical protein